MTLFKKNGMWISDWSNKDSDDDQGCDKRQKEQIQKAFDLIGKMEKQGWKEIGFSGYGYQDVGLAKSAKIMKEHLPQIEKAVKSHDADIRKKWGQKKVKMWKRPNAYVYFIIDWIFDGDNPLKSLAFGELGGCAALMNKGNEYRLIFTYGSDDDEAGYWSKPVTQIVFKSKAAKPAAKKPKAKPRAKAPARKPKAKAKPKAKKTTTRKSKSKSKVQKDRTTDVKKRKAPPYSAKQFPKGARKKGNDGKIHTVVTDKRGVKKWKA